MHTAHHAVNEKLEIEMCNAKNALPQSLIHTTKQMTEKCKRKVIMVNLMRAKSFKGFVFIHKD